MKPYIFSIILLLSVNLLSGQTLPKIIKESDFTIGKTISIKSETLDETRAINIYLPLSYSDNSTNSYPVIYLLDGSKDEDFIHISGIVQFCSFPWINIIPESIVVGIENIDRQRDFTYPSHKKEDNKEFPTSGQSSKFINFIENELQPFIDIKYRTTKENTIIGQSLGGLLATEILFKKPNLFDNYIIVSPSLWWDNEKLLETEPKPYKSKKAIYIAGGKEGKIMERTTKELFIKLNKNRKPNTNVYYDFLKNKTHGDALHIAVYHAFEKLQKKD